jgi:hypothetical protein
MAELIDVVNCLFVKRSEYKNLSIEDKDKFFFIINRYLAKKFPEIAQNFNIKMIDKSVCLDLWFIKKPWEEYPNQQFKYAPSFFWKKSSSEKGDKKKEIISEKDIKLLSLKLNLRIIDIKFLITYHIKLIKEELKYYKELEKQE